MAKVEKNYTEPVFTGVTVSLNVEELERLVILLGYLDDDNDVLSSLENNLNEVLTFSEAVARTGDGNYRISKKHMNIVWQDDYWSKT